jgi:hypothetical protein
MSATSFSPGSSCTTSVKNVRASTAASLATSRPDLGSTRTTQWKPWEKKIQANSIVLRKFSKIFFGITLGIKSGKSIEGLIKWTERLAKNERKPKFGTIEPGTDVML